MKLKFLNIGIALTTIVTSLSVISCSSSNKELGDNDGNNTDKSTNYEPLAPGTSVSKLSLNDLMVYSSADKNTRAIGDFINWDDNKSFYIDDGQIFVKNYLAYQKTKRAENDIISQKQYNEIIKMGSDIVATMYYAKYGNIPKKNWLQSFKESYNIGLPYYNYFKNSSIKNKIPLEINGEKIQWV